MEQVGDEAVMRRLLCCGGEEVGCVVTAAARRRGVADEDGDDVEKAAIDEDVDALQVDDRGAWCEAYSWSR